MTQKQAQTIVDKFNKLYPIGSTVKLRKIGKKTFPQIDVTVKSEAYINSSNQPVAFFNELIGYYSIESPFIEY